MIQGYATADATETFVKRHHPLAVAGIGTTGLMVSQAGFGCYRVSTGIAHHKTALQKALRFSKEPKKGERKGDILSALKDWVTVADFL